MFSQRVHRIPDTGNNDGHQSTCISCGQRWAMCHQLRQPVEFHEGHIQASKALRGWSVFRTWGNRQPRTVDIVVASARIPATLPGNHISGQVPEFLLAEAGQDARVGLIEVVCCEFGNPLWAGSNCARPEILSVHKVQVPQHASLLMEDIFRTWVPMLKSCPHFLDVCARLSKPLSGRGTAQKMVQEELAGIRVWKLFGRCH